MKAKAIMAAFIFILATASCSTIEENPDFGPDYILQSTELCKDILEHEDGLKECVSPSLNFNNHQQITGLIILANVWADPIDPAAQFRVEVSYRGESDWDHEYEPIEIGASFRTDILYFSFKVKSVPPVRHDFVFFFRNSAEGEYEYLITLTAEVERIDPDFVYVRTVACLEIEEGPDWTKIPIGVSDRFKAGETIWALVEIERPWVDLQFLVEVKHNGRKLWNYEQEEIFRIDPAWGWDNAYFAVYQLDSPAGELEFIFYLRYGENIKNKDYEVLDRILVYVE